MIGDEQKVAQISQHIERHVGPIEAVIHELTPDLLNIDLHWVAASDDRPYHTLVTSGMSHRAMMTPDEASGFQLAELVMCLPPDWPLGQETLSEGQSSWPLQLLRQLARLPHEHQTWLSVGHKVPNGDPAEPYAPETQLCGTLLLPTAQLGEAFHRLKTDQQDIYFYNVFLLYAEELELLNRKGLDALLNRIDGRGLSDVLDLQRPNIGRKRFGLF